jgi:Resolvase, N terminal domain
VSGNDRSRTHSPRIRGGPSLLASWCNATRVLANVTRLLARVHCRRCASATGEYRPATQNPGRQHDALTAAGCEQIFIDQASGKLASRPKLDEALRIARDGDQLVITKLDRLGRSLEHLIALSAQLQTRGLT